MHRTTRPLIVNANVSIDMVTTAGFPWSCPWGSKQMFSGIQVYALIPTIKPQREYWCSMFPLCNTHLNSNILCYINLHKKYSFSRAELNISIVIMLGCEKNISSEMFVVLRKVKDEGGSWSSGMNVFPTVSKRVYGYCGLNMEEHLWKQYHWYEKVGDFFFIIVSDSLWHFVALFEDVVEEFAL